MGNPVALQNILPSRHWRRSGIFIVNFEHSSHLALGVYIVDFEHVIAGCVIAYINLIELHISLVFIFSWKGTSIFFYFRNNNHKHEKVPRYADSSLLEINLFIVVT